MKLLLIAAIITFYSCTNDDKASNWINNAKKPIKCYKAGENSFGHKIYTVIDNEGKVYYTGWIKMFLPDTIK